MRTLLAAALLVSLVVVVGQQAPATHGPGATETVEPAITLVVNKRKRARFEKRVIKKVNKKRARKAERTGKKCRALKTKKSLRRAARRHSRTMAARDWFSHGSSSYMVGRIERSGYTPWRQLGENIAKGQMRPKDVVRAWMQSPGHRSVILNCSFRHTGVGLHIEGGVRWWTQDFGRKW